MATEKELQWQRSANLTQTSVAPESSAKQCLTNGTTPNVPSTSVTTGISTTSNSQTSVSTGMFQSQVSSPLAMGSQISTITGNSPSWSQKWTRGPLPYAQTSMNSGSEDPPLFSLSSTSLQELMTTFTSQVSFKIFLTRIRTRGNPIKRKVVPRKSNTLNSITNLILFYLI